MKKLIFILGLFASFNSFAQEQHLAELTPAGGGLFPLMRDSLIKGGLTIVADTNARNAISTLRRKYNSFVYTAADTTMWRMASTSLANSGWKKVILGGTSKAYVDRKADSLRLYRDVLPLYIPLSQKAVANGIATLDPSGKIWTTQLPGGFLQYKGVWSALTNAPVLSDATGTAGQVYQVSVAGTQNLGSGAISYSPGDWVIHNGTSWQKSAGTSYVNSVNGQQGIVSLTSDNINQGTVNLYFSNANVLNSVLTGYTKGAGSAAITASDNVLGAIQKLDGNLNNNYVKLDPSAQQVGAINVNGSITGAAIVAGTIQTGATNTSSNLYVGNGSATAGTSATQLIFGTAATVQARVWELGSGAPITNGFNYASHIIGANTISVSAGSNVPIASQMAIKNLAGTFTGTVTEKDGLFLEAQTGGQSNYSLHSLGDVKIDGHTYGITENYGTRDTKLASTGFVYANSATGVAPLDSLTGSSVGLQLVNGRLAIQSATATSPGILTTASQTIGGAKTFNLSVGTLGNWVGGYISSATGASNSNFAVTSSSGGISSGPTTQTELQFGGSNTVHFRAFMRGSAAGVPGNGQNYGAFIIGSQSVQVLNTYTVPFAAQQVIKDFAVTNTGTLNEKALLYLEAPSKEAITGAAYSLHALGQVKIDQHQVGNAGTDSILVTSGGIVKAIAPGSIGTGTVTGDVSITSGVSTIGNNKVTYAKMQAMTNNRLLGSGEYGTAVQEIYLGPGLSFSNNVLNITAVNSVSSTNGILIVNGPSSNPIIGIDSTATNVGFKSMKLGPTNSMPWDELSYTLQTSDLGGVGRGLFGEMLYDGLYHDSGFKWRMSTNRAAGFAAGFISINNGSFGYYSTDQFTSNMTKGDIVPQPSIRVSFNSGSTEFDVPLHISKEVFMHNPGAGIGLVSSGGNQFKLTVSNAGVLLITPTTF